MTWSQHNENNVGKKNQRKLSLVIQFMKQKKLQLLLQLSIMLFLVKEANWLFLLFLYLQ